MRDERGELRGLLIVLGLVMALGAVVFGFGLRAHKTSTTAAKVTAGTTTSTAPAAPTTTAVPADPGVPAVDAAVTPSAAPGSAPAAPAPRTAPAVTSPPATAPPATSPPATSPPATTAPTSPPTTAVPFSCTFTLSDTSPASGESLTMTIQTNSPNRQFALDHYVNGQIVNSGVHTYQTDGSGRFTDTVHVLEKSGDRVRLVARSGGSCEADYTVR